MEQNPLIKVGYLISYDYEYLKNSLSTTYNHADVIYLAIDKDRLTWKGKPFTIEDSFFDWVKTFDKDSKIHIYEDSFYVPELQPMECETRERNLLGEKMGKGGWHVQIDTDEYFLEFEKLVIFLKSLNINTPTSIRAEWITIFKHNGEDYFLVDANERFPLATNCPEYTNARETKRLKKRIKTQFKVLHHSWGRTDEELKFKLNNWGHTHDFNAEAYFNLWKTINRDTYKYLHNFHPLDQKSWETLECISANDIPELIEKIKERENNKPKTSLWNRLFRK